jgi:hypothetical protein
VLLGVVLNTEHIRLATHLAILHVRLRAPGGLVHHRQIPLTAAGTLKSRFQSRLIFNFSQRFANMKSETSYNGDSQMIR